MASAAQPNPRKLSPRDTWRRRTNYQSGRISGWAPLTFAAVAEIGRLTSGKATQLMYVLWAATMGQRADKYDVYQEVSPDLSTLDLASLAACDERTVQRELTDLARRGLIDWEQPKKGVNRIKLLFRVWESLPDYKAGPVEEPAPVPDETPEQTPEEKAKVPGHTEITRKPVHVEAGKTSKPLKVECGVSAIQFRGNVDAKWSAVVDSGVLTISITHQWRSKDGVSGLVQTNEIDANIRQACRISPSEARGKETKGERRTEGETCTRSLQHPRSLELSRLFDPFTLRGRSGKPLSDDPVALQAACEAIADTPHDFLVRCAVERAAREIKSPRVAVAICLEVARNWLKVQKLPPGKQFGGSMSASDRRSQDLCEALKQLNEMKRRGRGVA